MMRYEQYSYIRHIVPVTASLVVTDAELITNCQKLLVKGYVVGLPVIYHAVRACYAALRRQEAVKSYAAEVQRIQGVQLHIRVGVNTGKDDASLAPLKRLLIEPTEGNSYFLEENV